MSGKSIVFSFILYALAPTTAFCSNLWTCATVNGHIICEEINANSGAVVQTTTVASGTIPVNQTGVSLAYGAGNLWICATVNGHIICEEINRSSGAVVQTTTVASGMIPVDQTGVSLAYGAGNLWICATVNGHIISEEINANSGAVVQTTTVASGTIPVNQTGVSLAYGAGNLWTCATVNGHIICEEINRSSGAVVQTTTVASGMIPVNQTGVSLAYGAGNLWTCATVNGHIISEEINANSGAVVQTTTVASGTIPVDQTGVSVALEQQWSIVTSSSPANAGSTTGAGTYDDGTTATVNATSDSCYTFVNWTLDGGVVSTSSNYSFTAIADESLVANFSSVTYSVTTSASPTAGGTIGGSGTVDCGASVTLVATPNPCYSFENWTEGGTVLNASTNYSFTASGNLSVVANFVPLTYVLITTNSPFGAGTASGGGTLSCGSTAQITAAPNPGFGFTGWSGTGPGSYTGTNNPVSVTMDGNITETANYVPNTSYALAMSNVVEGPAAGTNTVVLSVRPETAAWTATTNAGWLHPSTQSQSGTGSTNLVFSYDSNPEGTRTDQLTIGGVPLFVTQAGANYMGAPGPATILVSSGLSGPKGIALDSSGNVYIADTGSSAIRKWTRTNNALSTLVSSNSITPLNAPQGIAVDAAGNVYIADTGDAAVKEWVAATGNVTTLPITGLRSPSGLAIDVAGNVYIADTGNGTIEDYGTIEKWVPGMNVANSLVSVFLERGGIAVDLVGNVYYSAGYTHGILVLTGVNEWVAATSNQTTLVSGLNFATGVAVDGAGNVYVAYAGQDEILEAPAANRNGLPVVTGLNFGAGVAVDGADNIYVADTDNNAIKELPHAFVDPTPKLEGLAAGNDSLPTVLPTSANLLGPFAPTTDQSWLTVTGVTNGVVSFSFTANAGPARTAHISVLGLSIPIIQGVIGTPPSLTGVRLLENESVELTFTNVPSAAFTVLCTTNLSLPVSAWTPIGAPVETSPGQYQVTDPQPVTVRRFYTARSPY